MIADLLLRPVAANVIRNVGPRSQAVLFSALQESQLLIGAPVFCEYGYGVLFDDLVGVGSGIMVAVAFGFGKTRHAKVVVLTGGICTTYAHLDGLILASADRPIRPWREQVWGVGVSTTYRRGDVRIAEVAVVFVPPSRTRLLLDDGHGGGGGKVRRRYVYVNK